VRRIALAVLLLAALPAGASAAPPDPFGHPCREHAFNVVHCPTASDADRVPSFDGTPLDVDVTLPATGDGPFATIVLLHGFGSDKTAFQSADPNAGGRLQRYNTAYLAQQGYAVVTPSARGFGRSCGAPDSRTAGCERGFIRLADHRYEARDVQHLLGLLVDQGVADPARLGVTGESYGGGTALTLAVLADRIRRPDGSFAPWTSPNGTALRLAAAAPIIPWSDLAAALAPNGRFRDTLRPSQTNSLSPVGVPKESYVDGLYTLATLRGFVAPAGAAPEADLTTWRARFRRGEPFGADATAIGAELYRYHSALSLPRSSRPALLHIASGWNDDLFPVDQALRAYNALRERAVVQLNLGDFGHMRAGNAPATLLARNQEIFGFFFCTVPAGPSRCSLPTNPVTARLTPCPGLRATTYRARTWHGLHPGQLLLRGGRASRTIRSHGADTSLDRQFNPVGGADEPCKTVRLPRRPRGAVVYETRSPGITLLGTPTVAALVRARGSNGMVVARLWDVDPRTRRGRLISRGVYRLTTNESRSILFQLQPQGYRLRRGRVIRLELRGADRPTYRRSNSRFTARVASVVLQLPVRQRRGTRRGVTTFQALRLRGAP
jgi:pimeloyl-ACP methyl ester carboxylesterase